MSILPGNEHYDGAMGDLRDAYDAEPGPKCEAHTTAAQVNATLAVAHEMRTANLLGVLNAQWSNGAAMFPREANEPDVHQEILRRLGLEEEK